MAASPSLLAPWVTKVKHLAKKKKKGKPLFFWAPGGNKQRFPAQIQMWQDESSNKNKQTFHLKQSPALNNLRRLRIIPVKSMCECVFVYSTITAFKASSNLLPTPPETSVSELSSCSELHRASLKQLAVISPRENVGGRADVTFTATHTHHSHHCPATKRVASSDDDTGQGATLGIILCLGVYFVLWRCLTWGFERMWGHLQASTHQTSRAQTQNTGRGSYTAV